MRISVPLSAVASLLLLILPLSAQQNQREQVLSRGYALVGKDPVAALDAFREAQQIAPSDTIALQIAYLLHRVGRDGEADSAFVGLTASTNADFRERAQSALLVLDDLRRSQRVPDWLRVSTAALNDSRLRDGILWATVQGGRCLSDDRVWNVVGSLGLSADTRSTGGQLPVLYSDNVLLLAAGVRVLPFSGGAIDVEGGIAYDVRVRGTRARTRGDFRAIGTYGTGIYPIPVRAETMRLSGSLFADFGMSAGYYSRYSNAIAYMQGRAGIRLLEYRAAALDAYALAYGVADTRRDYANNVMEAGGGLRLVPEHSWGVALHFEFRRGEYVGETRRDAPGDLYYSTFRFMAVVERFF